MAKEKRKLSVDEMLSLYGKSGTNYDVHAILEKGKPLLVEKLFGNGLSEIEVVHVLTALDEVCNQCWEREKPCTCCADIGE